MNIGHFKGGSVPKHTRVVFRSFRDHQAWAAGTVAFLKKEGLTQLVQEGIHDEVAFVVFKELRNFLFILKSGFLEIFYGVTHHSEGRGDTFLPNRP